MAFSVLHGDLGDLDPLNWNDLSNFQECENLAR